MNQLRELTLASASPRRAELLTQIGVEFTKRPVDLDESALPAERPSELVMRLAGAKAKAAAKLLQSTNNVILASDTIVVLDDEALGKPVDFAHARQMLSSLSGRSHQVLTAISVKDASRQKTVCVATDVHFATLSDEDIEQYWATGEPADKAGAYGIQGIAGQFVRSIGGSYSAVVGLPLYETVQLLKEFEVIK
ncbi:Maf family protein [Alteromonas gilva]|uniref:dTTP/UTP pyrophosphatase n=1 Tax=Alteromonas gilva TaxID=2987522 RepID=A0ABT5KYM2_9ALTE|nr:Maf family protein [Alteromonas gilva]MDC8829742.1 Maf family protein [Alteromonas gilva]